MSQLTITVYVLSEELNIVTAGGKPSKFWTNSSIAINEGINSDKIVTVTVPFETYNNWNANKQLLKG